MATYSEQDIAELFRKLHEERQNLLRVLGRLDDTRAERQPLNAEGGREWSAKQQLPHLLHGERMWLGGAHDAVARPGQPAGAEATHLEGVAEEGGPPLAALIEALEREREQRLGWIRSLPREAFARTAVHPSIGEMTAMQWIRALYRHDRLHAEQIEAALDA